MPAKHEDKNPAEEQAPPVDHGDPDASPSVYQPAKDDAANEVVLKAPPPPPGQPGAPATAVFTEMVPVAQEGVADRPEESLEPAQEPKD